MVARTLTGEVLMYERFIGTDAEIVLTAQEQDSKDRVVESGRIMALSAETFLLGSPLKITHISGAVTLEGGKTDTGYFVCDSGTVVFAIRDWKWAPSHKIVTRLHREKLVIGDIITIRTQHGWRGVSSVAVRVVEITDCGPSSSTITVEPDGFEQQSISITDATVEVHLYCQTNANPDCRPIGIPG
jgi:hypothetical protein